MLIRSRMKKAVCRLLMTFAVIASTITLWTMFPAGIACVLIVGSCWIRFFSRKQRVNKGG